MTHTKSKLRAAVVAGALAIAALATIAGPAADATTFGTAVPTISAVQGGEDDGACC